MKKILHIVSSINGNRSFSIELGNAIIEKIKLEYPDSQVTERNLVMEGFPHLEENTVNAFFTPQENRTAEHLEALKDSDAAIKELFGADILVIGAPLYNFGIPSTLKAWLDHIARAGVTFSYDEKGPKGLVTGKKVYIAMATGGIYSEGPMQAYDFVSPYLKTVLGFLGMHDVEIVRAEGTSLTGNKKEALGKAMEALAG
ncbi:MAG: NAD(P)H-dependent oxidoreductase [Sediminicola sp.]